MHIQQQQMWYHGLNSIYTGGLQEHIIPTSKIQNIHISKNNQCKIFPKGDHSAGKRWQRQAAAADQRSLGHMCIFSWSLGDRWIMCRLLVAFAISLQGEHALRYLLFVNKASLKEFPKHMQHSFFPRGGINPLQNSHNPTHIWCCSLMTSRELS